MQNLLNMKGIGDRAFNTQGAYIIPRGFYYSKTSLRYTHYKSASYYKPFVLNSYVYLIFAKSISDVTWCSKLLLLVIVTFYILK